MDYYDELRWPDPNARYIVEACNKKNLYVVYEGCGMTDFTEILPVSEIEDEESFVTLAMLYDHSISQCFVEGNVPDNTACCPVVADGYDYIGDLTIYKVFPFQNVNYVEWLSENSTVQAGGCI